MHAIFPMENINFLRLKFRLIVASADHDQCSKVTAVVHGIVMGIEMPFTLPNPDGCLNSGITCPVQKGSNYEYSTTLPVLKQYPKV